jgi:hypothetical protein
MINKGRSACRILYDLVLMPARIQLKRTRGWRMPPNTVKVDRTTRFGNPFPITAARSRKDALAAFADYLRHRLTKEPAFLEPLRGKNLACWCPPDQPCHADILLEAANRSRKSHDQT